MRSGIEAALMPLGKVANPYTQPFLMLSSAEFSLLWLSLERSRKSKSLDLRIYPKCVCATRRPRRNSPRVLAF
jgi:hypothetical protein